MTLVAEKPKENRLRWDGQIGRKEEIANIKYPHKTSWNTKSSSTRKTNVRMFRIPDQRNPGEMASWHRRTTPCTLNPK